MVALAGVIEHPHYYIGITVCFTVHCVAGYMVAFLRRGVIIRYKHVVVIAYYQSATDKLTTRRRLYYTRHISSYVGIVRHVFAVAVLCIGCVSLNGASAI